MATNKVESEPHGQTSQGPGQYPQPVVQQPQHTTVVVNQQVNRSQRGWTQGLFGCFDDFGICIRVTCCPCLASIQLAQDMGENMCLTCCVPNWMTAARTKVRMQRQIAGSIFDDCVVSCFCGMCAMCQLWREAQVVKRNAEM